MSKAIYFGLGLLGAAAMGYLAGRISAPPSSGSPLRPEGYVRSERLDHSPAGSSKNERALSPLKVQNRPLSLEELQAEASDLYREFDLRNMRRIVELQDRLEVSDVEKLIREFGADSSSGNDGLLLELLYSARAHKDPGSAANLALASRNPKQRKAALQIVLPMFAKENPKLAISWLEQITDPLLKAKARAHIVMGLSESAPPLAIAQLSEGEGVNADDIRMIFLRWATNDLQQSQTAASKLSGHGKIEAIRAISQVMAGRDWEAAWEFASANETAKYQGGYQREQILGKWAETDPERALAMVKSEKEGRIRDQLLTLALVTWSKSDFCSALAAATQIPNTTLRALILRRLSETTSSEDAKDLLPHIKAMPATEQSRDALTRLFSSWGNEAPREAADAALAEFPAEKGRMLARNVISQWARNNGGQNEILSWLQAHPELKPGTLNDVFHAWGVDGSPSALQALGQLDPNDRPKATKAFARGWCSTDPEAVVRWAASLPPSADQTEMMMFAIADWAGRSPKEAAAYVDRMPQKGSAMADVVHAWAHQDLASAATWLRKQPDSPQKDKALEALSTKQAMEDPSRGIEWATRIQNPDLRIRQIVTLVNQWASQDRAAAMSWVAQANLPEAARAQIR